MFESPEDNMEKSAKKERISQPESVDSIEDIAEVERSWENECSSKRSKAAASMMRTVTKLFEGQDNYSEA